MPFSGEPAIQVRGLSKLFRGQPAVDGISFEVARGRFLTILGKHYPTWREARAELNELPLGAEAWGE